jgi:multiple sugar transport system ATP-binding protein
MASVGFEAIGKRYENGQVALEGIDLEVADGERLVVVGPSGCGKSTLLRIVAGLERATRGTLRIGGRAVNELSPRERNVAMVFQDYALYPHKTVRGNLEFPLRMRRMPAAEMQGRVERTAGLLGLGAKLERLPRELSGGERQRVAMGRALVREPAVFLLDEPLSNLDAKLRVEVRAEIAELQRRTGTTMLYVTHDQVEAMTLGHRVAVLDRGRLRQGAPPRELYDRPANAFVAGFVGSPPMNLFEATVERDAEGAGLLRVGDQTVRLPAATLAALDAADGGRIVAGIRPEALDLARDDSPGEVTLAGVVAHVEALGHESIVGVRIGGERSAVSWSVRTSATGPIEPGAAVRVRLDAGALHWFSERGEAIRG